MDPHIWAVEQVVTYDMRHTAVSEWDAQIYRQLTIVNSKDCQLAIVIPRAQNHTPKMNLKWRWKNESTNCQHVGALVASSFPSVSMLPLLISPATWPSSIQRWSRCYSDAWRPHLQNSSISWGRLSLNAVKDPSRRTWVLIHPPNSQLESLTWDEVAIRFAHPVDPFIQIIKSSPVPRLVFCWYPMQNGQLKGGAQQIVTCEWHEVPWRAWFGHTFDDEFKIIHRQIPLENLQLYASSSYISLKLLKRPFQCRVKSSKRKCHRTKISSDKVQVDSFLFLAHPQPIIPF